MLLCIFELFVSGQNKIVVVYLMGEFEIFEVLVDCSGVCWLVVANGDDLTLTDFGWGRSVGF